MSFSCLTFKDLGEEPMKQYGTTINLFNEWTRDLAVWLQNDTLQIVHKTVLRNLWIILGVATLSIAILIILGQWQYWRNHSWDDIK